MKRFLISMAALLAVVGCAQQEDLVSADLGAVNAPEFEVGFESSRVFIDETDGGFKLAWTQGDLLSCFLNTGGQAQYKFEGETGADNGIIKAVSCPSGEAIDAFYAVYPYNEANALADGILTVTLPAEQDYAVGTFAPNANTMVSINAAKEPYYTFSNVCGFIRLKVYGDATITSIEFKGNNEEVIAGVATVNPASENKALTIAGEGKTITLNCGEGVALGATEAEATEFWLVVPPMPFDEGFTVTLTDAEGNSMEKKLDKDFTVERNKVHDGVIAYEVKPAVVVDPNLLFDAQFNENGTATDGGKFGMTIQRMVDENGATPDMSTAYDSKIQRNVVTFTHVPTDPVNETTPNPNLNHSYYLVDFSENAEFEAAITDGYTFEMLTYRVEPIAGNTVWSFPFAFGAAHTNNGGWGIYHNSRGATWVPGWQIFSKSGWGGAFWNPAMNQYEHLIVACDANGKNYAYENGILRYTTTRPLNLLDGHKNFAIGGMPLNGGICREYYGQVAMIRIYDNLMTAQEAMARYNELNLPVKPINDDDVVLDVNLANGSVSDAGKYKLPIKVVGEPTVDNGVLTLSNPAGATNQYIVVDASAQWDEIYNLFISNGFTFETVIARTSADAEGAPFSIGATGDNAQGYRLQALAGENHLYKSWSWQNVGMSDEAGLHRAVADLDMFYHVVAKYESGGTGGGCFSIFVNGEFVAQQQQTKPWGLAMNQNFTSQLFGIGAMPKGAYDSVTGALGFDGKIALARLYGNIPTASTIKARYNELKPTIDALNQETINDRLNELNQYVLMDAKFNADGTVTDQSKYQLPMKAVGGVTIENGVATLSNPAGATNNYIVANADSNWDAFYSDMVNNGGFSYETIVSRTTADAEGTIFALGVNSTQKQTFRVQAIAGAEHYYKIWSWQNVPMNNESGMHSATPNLDEFYHVVAKAEGGPDAFFWSIYVNGEFVSIMSQPNSWGFCTNDINHLLGIGGRPVGAYDGGTGEYGFDGKIASARLYGKALSGGDVKACYNSVKAQIDALNAK